jgi:hypothetical protein
LAKSSFNSFDRMAKTLIFDQTLKSLLINTEFMEHRLKEKIIREE